MAKLAIRGHATRGKEVIEILEMLGGENNAHLKGMDINLAYCIFSEGYITTLYAVSDKCSKVFTLEKFLQEFPYKVGDKVKCWINGYCGIHNIRDIQWDSIVNEVKYRIGDYWYSTMNLQPYEEEVMEDKPNLLQQLKEYFENTPREVIEKEWHEYDKYNDISPKVNEYLEYVNNIRQPKYPKTYEECCKMLNIISNNELVFSNPNEESEYAYRNKSLYNAFDRLKICRDAYWKIAGEQMGLDKPWKPDWTNEKQIIYGLYNELKYSIINPSQFVFPTEEMRDAFYENFKELIEKCKELL